MDQGTTNARLDEQRLLRNSQVLTLTNRNEYVKNHTIGNRNDMDQETTNARLDEQRLLRNSQVLTLTNRNEYVNFYCLKLRVS